MNNDQPNKQEEIICYCSGTTEAKIKTLIANQVNTIELIAYETGATTGCGSCEYSIMELLKTIKAQ